MGKQLFHTELTSEVLDIREEVMSDGHVQHHVIFKVTLDSEVKNSDSKALMNSCSSDFHDVVTDGGTGENPLISSRTFANIFPFHVVFDHELRIQQCGTNIQKVSEKQKICDLKLDDVFTLAAPRMPLTYDNIIRFINACYVLEMKKDIRKTKTENSESGKELSLKGKKIACNSDDWSRPNK